MKTGFEQGRGWVDFRWPNPTTKNDPAEIRLRHPYQRCCVWCRLLQIEWVVHGLRRDVEPILMLSIKNLPLWAKSLVAPAVVLVAMFAMAGTAFVNLANQEADREPGRRRVRRSASGDGRHRAVTDFQTELYHLTSTAANETDHSKVEAAALRLGSGSMKLRRRS